MLEYIIPTVTGIGGASLAWAVGVERRLTKHETLLDKVDELVTMLIEEKRGGSSVAPDDKV